MQAPFPNEYSVFYKTYVDLVPKGNIISTLDQQHVEFTAFIKTLSSEKLNYRYAEDKWTIAEVLGHVLDAERVFAYRILRFSRNDKTPIPGFDQDPYIANALFNDRTLDSFVQEFDGLRAANLEMIKGLSEEQTMYTGESDGRIVSVRALVYILAGHVFHHWNILNNKYLNH